MFALSMDRKHNAFDRHSHFYYGMLFALTAIVLVCLTFSDFIVGTGTMVSTFSSFVLLIPAAWTARVYGMGRIAMALESIALPAVFGSMLTAINVLTCAIALPFADNLLSAADVALGFDWLALFHLYKQFPWLDLVSSTLYFAFTLQMLLTPIALAIWRPDRFWLYMTSLAVALVIAAAIFPFATAAGPFVQYGVQPAEFHYLERLYPWETGPVIERIRDGSLRNIGEAARGLISIPSLHAGCAVIFAWAWWNSRILRYPLVLINAGMTASAIITGAHYLVDLIAGLAVGAAAIRIATWLLRDRDHALPDKRLNHLASLNPMIVHSGQKASGTV